MVLFVCLFVCLCRPHSPIISSKQQLQSSAAAIASYSNSFTRHDLTVRDTTIRAIAASRQHEPINIALIARAVFISARLLTVDAMFCCCYWSRRRRCLCWCLIFTKKERNHTRKKNLVYFASHTNDWHFVATNRVQIRATNKNKFYQGNIWSWGKRMIKHFLFVCPFTVFIKLVLLDSMIYNTFYVQLSYINKKRNDYGS